MDSLPQSQPSDDIDNDDLFGHLLDYQATDEFTQDVMRQHEIEIKRRPTPQQEKEQQKRYRDKYPQATLMREQAKKHKAALYKKQNGLCYLCKLPLGSKTEIDHIHPISKGGGNEIDNLGLCHPRCNHKKHAKVLKNPDNFR